MASQPLLSRDAFRDQVFARDKHKCVFCGNKAEDAHHILDRKLFPDGGYYIGNGSSVCNACHLLCENCTYSVEEVRDKTGITEIVLPPGFDSSLRFDKWGNIILTDRRIKGPLFYDTAVQKLFKKDLWRYDDPE